ncbi:MAG: MiaB/RimO family radical SAM methylthiotransferase [bacterium]|nr:MiaB/RimO family radical SAM methylthiotransferase [bacterium]
MKYFIKTYGCQMNEADSEKIAGYFQSLGFAPAQKMEEADEIVINTCSVRQSAEDRVLGLINNFANLKGVAPIKREQKIILTGCMLRYPLKWLQEKMPQVDEFKKIKEFTNHTPYAIGRSLTHAWVAIMEGCNNFCTYCVVPYARGREKSRPFEEIICEVEELVKRGYKEITLLGQNVNSYGKDFKNPKVKIKKSKLQVKTKNFKTSFAQLLLALNKISGLEKIKFMTSNPWDLTDEIIEVMKLPKIERYLHLPVQSGDDEILRRMNRRYTAKSYLRLVEKVRRKIPEIEIGTDIIVGFPGETDEQFQKTVDLCKRVGFKVAYIAMYSPRPQTAAYKLKDDISHEEKRKRWRVLEKLINSAR